MKRKLIPVIMMLVSGAICCLFTMVRGESLLFRMTTLLGAMLLFYGLGWVLCSVLNYFDSENENDWRRRQQCQRRKPRKRKRARELRNKDMELTASNTERRVPWMMQVEGSSGKSI